METAQSLRKQNIDTYKAISQGPLEEVKALLRSEADTYVFPYNFVNVAERKVVQTLTSAVQSYEEHSPQQRDANNEASQNLIAQVAKRFIEDDLQPLLILIWANFIGCLFLIGILAAFTYLICVFLRNSEALRALKWSTVVVGLVALIAVPNGRSFTRSISVAVLTPIISSIGAYPTCAVLFFSSAGFIYYVAKTASPKPPVPQPLLREFDQPSPFASVGPYGGAAFAHTPANNRASVGAYYPEDTFSRPTATHFRSRLSCPETVSRTRK